MEAHSLTFGQSIMVCFYTVGPDATSPRGKLHPVATAMLIVIMISIRTHSVLDRSFYR